MTMFDNDVSPRNQSFNLLTETKITSITLKKIQERVVVAIYFITDRKIGHISFLSACLFPIRLNKYDYMYRICNYFFMRAFREV